MGNLIIEDSDYENLSRNLRSYADIQEEKLQSYTAALADICANGVSSGQTFKNIQNFLSDVTKLKGQFRGIAENTASTIDTYLADIDAADKNYY